jgi:hypothetical protein
MSDFRVTVPPCAVTSAEKQEIVERLSCFLGGMIADNTNAHERSVYQVFVSERATATTGIELNCSSVIDDKEHLRAMLHGSASVLAELFGTRFNIRARTTDEDDPWIEFRLIEPQPRKRKTA